MKRMILAFVFNFLPWKMRCYMLNKVFHHNIHSDAYISRCALLDIQRIEMASGAVISAGNVIKGLSSLKMQEHSYIGTLNWISGYPLMPCAKHFASDPHRACSLQMEAHSCISSRHIIDCTDKVTLGEYSTVAGYRSQILTHSVNIKESKQRCSPVTIGKYCFIGTSVTILPGSVLPDYCVLAANSLLNKQEQVQWSLYGGVPAKKIGDLQRENVYFQRKIGFID